jgi:addiction module HigA family antidote
MCLLLWESLDSYILQAALEPLGVSAYKLAQDIGVPRNRVSAIINGTRAITADTALRLAQYFGTSADMWMSLQATHDLRVVQRDHGRAIVDAVAPVERGAAA